MTTVNWANRTREDDTTHHFQAEPVVTPPGFSHPTFKIGDRVELAMTLLNPLSKGRYDHKTGTVTNIIFCKSDGQTVLYGVQFDTPADGAKGLRCEGFELNKLP